MRSRWFTNLRIFLVWLLGFALALVILALGHELFMVFITNTLRWPWRTARVLSMLYYVAAGLLCVAYYVLIEDYLKRSAKKGLLIKNSLRAIGTQVLAIGLIQTALMLYGFSPADWRGIGLVTAAVVCGTAMLFLSTRIEAKPEQQQEKS